MTFNLLDLVGESKIATKRENKKKLHKLLDKYGSVEEIERSGDLRDNFELDFARIDGALEEVLEERRLGYRAPQSSSDDEIKTNVKKSNSLLPDDEDFSLEGLTLSDRQRKAIDKLDMTNQLAVIRALREQQGVKKPKPKKENSEKSELDVLREKVDKANREIKVADNEHSGTTSDAEVEKDEESNNEKEDNNDKKMKKALADLNVRRNGGVSFHDIYHAKYNNGKLVQNATERVEGGYVNYKKDVGGPTNMGVTQNTLDAYKYVYKSSYKSDVSMPDNVKDLTKNQAMVILNEMFFRPYNINYIPDEKLARITFDSCVLAGPKMNKFFTEEILRVTEKKLYEVIDDKNDENNQEKINTVIPLDIARITSSLSEKQKTEIADNLLKARMRHHFNFIIKKHDQINNLEGWYERARSLFSDGKVFDELFLKKRNDFLTKYEDYLDITPYQRHQKRKKGLLK